MAAILNPEGILVGKILAAAHTVASHGGESAILVINVSGVKTFSPAPGSSIQKPVEKRGAFNVIVPDDLAVDVKALAVGTMVEILSTTVSINATNAAGVVYPLSMERAEMIEAA
jgi:hypothetical protein